MSGEDDEWKEVLFWLIVYTVLLVGVIAYINYSLEAQMQRAKDHPMPTPTPVEESPNAIYYTGTVVEKQKVYDPVIVSTGKTVTVVPDWDYRLVVEYNGTRKTFGVSNPSGINSL